MNDEDKHNNNVVAGCAVSTELPPQSSGYGFHLSPPVLKSQTMEKKENK
jgi:hypothetical protein